MKVNWFQHFLLTLLEHCRACIAAFAVVRASGATSRLGRVVRLDATPFNLSARRYAARRSAYHNRRPARSVTA
eukprot:2971029-Pleurochrysis_carterae.AAC.1